jgi:hypothetical protein
MVRAFDFAGRDRSAFELEEKGDDADAENQRCIPCDHLRDRGLSARSPFD